MVVVVLVVMMMLLFLTMLMLMNGGDDHGDDENDDDYNIVSSRWSIVVGEVWNCSQLGPDFLNEDRIVFRMLVRVLEQGSFTSLLFTISAQDD